MDKRIRTSRHDLQLQRTTLQAKRFFLVLAEKQRLAVLDENLGVRGDFLAGDVIEYRIVEDDAVLQNFDERSPTMSVCPLQGGDQMGLHRIDGAGHETRAGAQRESTG